jgi:cyclopropane-fatty-acyl-phospholipid synthase
MWELYLKASEMSFRHQAQMVFQMQLTRRLDALPMTRDYMTDWERGHGAESVRAAE